MNDFLHSMMLLSKAVELAGISEKPKLQLSFFSRRDKAYFEAYLQKMADELNFNRISLNETELIQVMGIPISIKNLGEQNDKKQ